MCIRVPRECLSNAHKNIKVESKRNSLSNPLLSPLFFDEYITYYYTSCEGENSRIH